MTEYLGNAVSVLNDGLNYIYKTIPAVGSSSKPVVEAVGKGKDDIGKWASDMAVSSIVGGPFVRLAGLSGALAVSLGAYGAHALKDREDIAPEQKLAFDTGNRYHLVHSAALLASPLCNYPLLTGSLLVVGVTLFSGSCYHYALSGRKESRKITPYGGVLIILAWISMML